MATGGQSSLSTRAGSTGASNGGRGMCAALLPFEAALGIPTWFGGIKGLLCSGTSPCLRSDSAACSMRELMVLSESTLLITLDMVPGLLLPEAWWYFM